MLNAQDQVFEILDSLKSMYGYERIQFETSKKYSFKIGEAPKYTQQDYANRIDQLNKYSPFKYTYNSIVQNYINRYISQPKAVSYILAKSSLYFPLFEKYLIKFSLPLELKNLAIVESALNPTAKSHCGAAGLWQFMYGTAKGYKLEINSLIDERFDPEKETIVACLYLKDLYDKYDDWPLALAAYNCGPGNVNKAIKRAGEKDFWKIYNYLPKETQGYVPGFIAASYITTFYEEHNITPVKNKILLEDLDFITVNRKTTLQEISKKFKIDYAQLTYLNPKYYIGIIPGDEDKIIVPIDFTDAKDFSKNNKNLEKITEEIPQQILSKNTNQNVTSVPNIVSKKNSPFGTLTKDSKSSNITSQELSSISKYTQLKTLNTQLSSNYSFSTKSDLKLKLSKSYVINGITYPINTILLAKAIKKPNSVYIKVNSIQFDNKLTAITLETEIFEKPEKGIINMQEGYDILFKL